MAKIYTNNPLVLEKLGTSHSVCYFEVGFRELLVKARDEIHKGHKLLTHPLSGSVKPNETPYKSLMLSDEAGPLDMDSVVLIEDAIITADKFSVKFPQMTDSIRADFQLIDLTLIQSAL